MVRWLEVGWRGSPPYFISHSDAYHTAPAHLFLGLPFSLLCFCTQCSCVSSVLFPPGVGQDVQLLMAAVQVSGSHRTLFGCKSPRTTTFHCQSQRAVRLSSEYLAVCGSCERCLGETNLRSLRVFRGKLWHRHGGRRLRGERRLRLDVRLWRVGHRTGCVRPVCLATCSLATLKPFLSLVRVA